MHATSHVRIRPTRRILADGQRHTVRAIVPRTTDRRRALAEQGWGR